MALLVQKYGGTSVGTPERIRNVAARIAKSYSEGNQLVVVVSAMGHTTDELIDLAHKVSTFPPNREMDMLLTAGERISMALLSMALSDLKIAALSLTGSQTGIITDDSHRRAKIKRILGDRVRAAIASGRVAIVAGFQGVSESKEITTLGRGGSDTTAVALAAALQADACQIYTDVDGVYSADPRIVANAKLWRTLPHSLMVEMAVCGAGVLHPRCVQLSKQYQVPLWVKNSLSLDLNGDEGTAVVDRKIGMEEFRIVGVTSDRTKMMVQLSLNDLKDLQIIWSKLAGANFTSLAPVFSGTQMSLFTDREDEREWRARLEILRKEGLIRDYKIDPDLVPISIVGDRISEAAPIYEMINVLSSAQIFVLSASASPLSVTLGVPLSSADDGVRVLHSRFLEGRN